MTFQDFLMNSPSGGLMIKVGDGTPIGGLPPWIASDTVNGGLMFKVNAAGYTPPNGMLQTATALSSSLQVVKDNLGNNSALALTTQYARFGVSGFWFITLNNSISHSAGNPLNINSDFGAITMGTGTISQNGALTIKSFGGNILSLRDSSNVEKVTIDNSGNVYAANLYTTSNGTTIGMVIPSYGSFQGSSNSGFMEINESANNKIRINTGSLVFNTTINAFGGLTNAYPAIKRNATGIDFRLADDSGYCDINSRYLFLYGDVIQGSGGSRFDLRAQYDLSFQCGRAAGTGGFSFGTSNFSAASSAIIEIQSTTKGFLPPRQTQAQRTAIASPAVGLMVYQTDTTEGLYVYKSTGWTFIA